MKEPESNSNSRSWNSDFEAFTVEYKSMEEWFTKIHKYERIKKIAEQEGKTLTYDTSVTPEGMFSVSITCH